MKLVILESYALHENDLDWGEVRSLVGEVKEYVRTDVLDGDLIAERIGDAELAILNKCHITEEVLARCPKLQWIGIIATGTDGLDLAACRRHGVTVSNVPGYSTYSVAQLTFSILLAICQCAERENRAVQAGHWQLNVPAEYGILPQVELCGKTFGIFGYGAIGQAAAKMAAAFGMKVLVHTRTIRPEMQGHPVEFVSFAELLRRSDVLSLHCPATPQTRGIISAAALEQMREGAILLNTARGALVDEAAVAAACKSGKLRFYGADAFAVEPLPMDSPLRGVENILLTPHVAWTTGEALVRLQAITTQNLRAFLAGAPQNVANP